MKHRVKVDVVTRQRGLFGMREVERRKTIVVSEKECCRMKQEKWNAPLTEEQRLAGLWLMWEEELAKENGEDW